MSFDESIARREVASHWRALRFSELVTTYFWLNLGSEIGFFSREAARDVVRQRLAVLLFTEQLERELTHVGYLFPPEFRRLLVEARQSVDLRVDGSSADFVQPSPRSYAAFRSAIVAETQITRSLAAEAVITVLNFAPSQFDRLLLRNQPIRLSATTVIDATTLTEGFAEIIGYMERLSGLSKRILTEPGLPVADRFPLERRLRQLTRWRVNQFVGGVNDYYSRIAFFVCRRSEIDWKSAEPRFQALLDGWGFTHARSMSV